eukprot:TRINITY_DN5908_c0_g3_i1.p1 TRINITY_DN5908_c0_g3~~TRINITY_DN5908_c0_g3_i1.p1  ORF type:complete len:305 (+),score=82.89 TRINITY_DN5908_c0_g3_i1:128-1042(+)
MPLERPVAVERPEHEKDKSKFLAQHARCRVQPMMEQLDMACGQGGNLHEILQHAGDLTFEKNSVLDLDRPVRGSTLLQTAAANKNTDAVQLLLLHGADPNKRAQVSSVHREDDEHGLPPLLHAAAGNQSAIVQLLLEHGADPNVTDSNGFDAVWYLLQGLPPQLVQEATLETPELVSVLDIAKSLAIAGYDPVAAENGGESVLERAQGFPPIWFEFHSVLQAARNAAAAVRMSEAEAHFEIEEVVVAAPERSEAEKQAVVQRLLDSGLMSPNGAWYKHQSARYDLEVYPEGEWRGSCGGFLPRY